MRGDEFTDVVIHHGVATSVVRRPTLAERMEAARAAAQFYAPKLAAVEAKSTVDDGGLSQAFRDLIRSIHEDGSGRIPLRPSARRSEGAESGSPTVR